MALGQIAKQEIAQEILKIFGEKAFIYEKDIRVNWVENGQPCQVKIALTAAKVTVNAGDDNAIPVAAAAPGKTPQNTFTTPATQEVPQPTAEEKQNISDLLKSLGL